MLIPSNETSFKRTFHWRGTGCSFFLFFFSIMWSAGSTLLNINNGTDNPCCCSCVPRSQFVLTVGVRGLTGKGNRVNPVPGGIGTWWWASAHKPSDQMFLVTLWKMSLRLWDRLRQTLLSIITDVKPQLRLNTSLRIREWNGTGQTCWTHVGGRWRRSSVSAEAYGATLTTEVS